MRQIHPVRFQEKFVASGIFSFSFEGKPRGLVEHWTVHEQPDGANIIRVDRDDRKDYGVSTLVEAWRSPWIDGGQIERVDMILQKDSRRPVGEVRATYSFFVDSMQVKVTVDGEERPVSEIALSPGYIIVPPVSFFDGFARHQAAQQPGQVIPTVFLHHFGPINIDSLQAVAGSMSVTEVEQDVRVIAGHAIPAKCYRYECYDPLLWSKTWYYSGQIWLDEHGILLEQPGQSVTLTQYSRRPEQG